MNLRQAICYSISVDRCSSAASRDLAFFRSLFSLFSTDLKPRATLP
jgi:hypothetical protein